MSYKITREAFSPAKQRTSAVWDRTVWSIFGLSLRWFEPKTRHQIFRSYCWENCRFFHGRRTSPPAERPIMVARV